ncbi:polysaccharide (de)acetylase [Flavobacterium pallidum]|uniref:Polysaccharide (De)acetylase n=1 Tax=Flavobacterium pallidum TaxID=2172098 RepID=A0A2S1SDI9_9FLAO|nr:polysaccharide (de)acetylase [Flavobacterium pallidum]AWI24449.1 polysaccharide (de)acetylase [Flavobacterium pallidum]
MSLKDLIKNNLYSISGWSTPRKIVVIESDDWGSIRMQSANAFAAMSQQFALKDNPFNRVDSLETESDMDMLYECLNAVKDKNGNHAKITANFLTANPDFEKIKASRFEQYFYEDFRNSYERYDCGNAFEKVQHGINAGIFYPQFHGREHVQVEYWMRDLMEAKRETLIGFEHGFFGFGRNEINAKGYLSSFNAASETELENVKKTIREGLQHFEKIFGFTSRSVIAPQNTMHPKLLPFLKENGVDVIQGARVRKQQPLHANEKPTVKRFMGSVNEAGQLDIVRNVTFEPGSHKTSQVDKALKEIEIAFRWGKPAVICSHRHNFMGTLDASNREKGFQQLGQLLHTICKKWPQTEFMTTIELANLIKSSKKLR